MQQKHTPTDPPPNPPDLFPSATPSENQKNLLEEVADLTGLLEDQAQRRTDVERRSRRDTSNTPVTETSTGSGGVGGGGGGGGAGAIPLSELRRYGKKLEEAVRSKEHAAEVIERLSLTRQRKKSTACGRSGGGDAGGLAACRNSKNRYRTGGGEGDGDGSGGSGGSGGGGGCGGDSCLPSSCGILNLAPAPGRPQEPRGGCRCLGDSLKALSGIGNGSGSGGIGGDSSVGRGEKDGLGPSGTGAAAGGAAAGGAAAAAGGGCDEKEEWGRGTLARKLRGAVRVSREEEKLDDERFWS